MTEDTFLDIWKTVMDSVRAVYADNYGDDFELDYNSADAKYALAVILENDLIDNKLPSAQEKTAFINAYHGLDVSGKSDLEAVGLNYMAIIDDAVEVLNHEILIKRCDQSQSKPVLAALEF